MANYTVAASDRAPPKFFNVHDLQHDLNFNLASRDLIADVEAQPEGKLCISGPSDMSEPSDSARRRHILSSINPQQPEQPSKRRRRYSSEQPHSHEQDPPPQPNHDKDASAQASYDDHDDATDRTRPRRSRLRLKEEKRRRRRSPDSHNHDEDAHSSSHRRRHRQRRHHHRSPTPPNPLEPPPLDSEAAFRESLFDAMADDEGAAFWEGVYGQPVHTYSHEKVGPQGELEQMTEEEYAAHVRQKMWEKTHAGLLEERARREQERKRKTAEERHARKLHEDMERSLRRGEERRRRKRWVNLWDEYVAAWADWDGSPQRLAWPVDTGQREDIAEQAVRDFFIRGLDLETMGETTFVARLKDERVRWHPDKIQQRLGGEVDSEIMRDVTSIFQIIDRLWSDTKGKQS